MKPIIGVLDQLSSPQSGMIPLEYQHILEGDRSGKSYISTSLMDVKLDIINIKQDLDTIVGDSGATFILQTPSDEFKNAQSLNSLIPGLLKQANGIISIAQQLIDYMPATLTNDHLWVGKKVGATDNVPIEVKAEDIVGYLSLPNKNVWVGNSSSVPVPVSQIPQELMPDLSLGAILKGSLTNRPSETYNFLQGPTINAIPGNLAVWGIDAGGFLPGGRSIEDSHINLEEFVAAIEESVASARASATAAAESASAAATSAGEATTAAGEATTAAGEATTAAGEATAAAGGAAASAGEASASAAAALFEAGAALLSAGSASSSASDASSSASSASSSKHAAANSASSAATTLSTFLSTPLVISGAVSGAGIVGSPINTSLASFVNCANSYQIFEFPTSGYESTFALNNRYAPGVLYDSRNIFEFLNNNNCRYTFTHSTSSTDLLHQGIFLLKSFNATDGEKTFFTASVASSVPNIDFTGTKLLGDSPTVSNQLATKGYVDSSVSSDAVLITGSTMTGPLILSGSPTVTNGAATKDYVDSYVSDNSVLKSGSSMTGPLMLSGSPLSNMQAVNKVYLDDIVTSLNSLISDNSNSINTINSTAVFKSGSTMTGQLILSGSPTVTNGAATKGYVDSAIGGAGTVTSIGATGSTGLVVGGSPITSSGTLTFTLSAGLQDLSIYNSSSFLKVINNFSDLDNSTTARTNLGLTNVSTQSVTQYCSLSGGPSNSIVSIGPGSIGQVLQSGGASANPAYSTATYPLTTTANRILYSSANSVIGELTSGNNGVLITSSLGVPSISTTIPILTQQNITRFSTNIVPLSSTATQSYSFDTSQATTNYKIINNSTVTAPLIRKNQLFLENSGGVSCRFDYWSYSADTSGFGTFRMSFVGTSSTLDALVAYYDTLNSRYRYQFDSYVSFNYGIDLGGYLTTTSSAPVDFSLSPTVLVPTPTLSDQASNKGYVDSSLSTIISATNNAVLIGGPSNTIKSLAVPTAANRVLMSTASLAPVFSSATYPSSTTANQLLYSSANNVVTGLATAPNSILVTNASSIPSISSTLPFTVPVSSGGSGRVTCNAYAVICGGTTTTSAHQSVATPGTSGQLLVSNGASALPTFQTYAGSASITTLGTITSGVWNGSIVTGTYGGTGINNGVKTITLGGNLVTSGAFNTTLTVTGNTNVTIPLSGTLVNTAVTSLSFLSTVGTIVSGIWNGTKVAVPYGGTGLTSTTPYGVICGGASANGDFQNAGTGTLGQVLISNGNLTLPTFGSKILDNNNSLLNLFFGSTCGNVTLGPTPNGRFNTGFGLTTLRSLTTGNVNSFFGSGGDSITSGSYNTGCGSTVLNALTNGSYNTGVGTYAGGAFASYNSCTFLGYGADNNATGYTNTIPIGFNAICTASDTCIIGTTARAMKLGIGRNPNGLIQTQNIVTNRSLVLYESANNDHQYYGLGINGAILRYQVDSSAASHVWYSAASSSSSNELMRLGGNGMVGLGTTDTTTAGMTIASGPNDSSGDTLCLRLLAGGGNAAKLHLAAYDGVNAVISKRIDGNLNITNGGPGLTLNASAFIYNGSSAQKNGSSSWAAISDKRTKNVVKKYTKGLNEVLKINPIVYKYNELSNLQENELSKEHVGVVAQEIEDFLPECVSISQQNEKVKDMRIYDSGAIIYLLINSVKELNSKIEILEKKAA